MEERWREGKKKKIAFAVCLFAGVPGDCSPGLLAYLSQKTRWRCARSGGFMVGALSTAFRATDRRGGERKKSQLRERQRIRTVLAAEGWRTAFPAGPTAIHIFFFLFFFFFWGGSQNRMETEEEIAWWDPSRVCGPRPYFPYTGM